MLLQIPEQYVEDIVGIITVVAAGDTMLSVREALDLKELLKDMTQNSQELQAPPEADGCDPCRAGG